MDLRDCVFKYLNAGNEFQKRVWLNRIDQFWPDDLTAENCEFAVWADLIENAPNVVNGREYRVFNLFVLMASFDIKNNKKQSLTQRYFPIIWKVVRTPEFVNWLTDRDETKFLLQVMKFVLSLEASVKKEQDNLLFLHGYFYQWVPKLAEKYPALWEITYCLAREMYDDGAQKKMQNILAYYDKKAGKLPFNQFSYETTRIWNAI